MASHSWEIDIEVQVRKTLHLGGPDDRDAVVELLHRLAANDFDLRTLAKWDLTPAGRVEPIEIMLGPAQIVAVRAVAIVDPGHEATSIRELRIVEENTDGP